MGFDLRYLHELLVLLSGSQTLSTVGHERWHHCHRIVGAGNMVSVVRLSSRHSFKETSSVD